MSGMDIPCHSEASSLGLRKTFHSVDGQLALFSVGVPGCPSFWVITGYRRPGGPHQDMFDHINDWLATLPHGNWILCGGCSFEVTDSNLSRICLVRNLNGVRLS